MLVQSSCSTIIGSEAVTLGVAMGVGLYVDDGLALDEAVPLAVLDDVADALLDEVAELLVDDVFDALGDWLGDGLADGLADGLGVVVGDELADVLPDPLTDVLADALGLGSWSGEESSMNVRVSPSGVARARTPNWPFWIPGMMIMRSIVVALSNVKVSSVPAPHDVLAADAQKVERSRPTSPVAGFPYPVEVADTDVNVTGVPMSGSTQ